jgi:sulfur-carrier protein
MIRIVLPLHLRRLAGLEGDAQVKVNGMATVGAVLDALEAKYPVLRGTIREVETGKRRAFVRFFACQEDLSHEGWEMVLPEAVVNGEEAFMVVGAVAGG